MNAAELKNALAARAEEVCRHLLPNGRRKGAEWHAGSISGEAGDSLKVHLVGEKAGVWKDYAGSADDAGDIFSLWQKCRGVDFTGMLKQVREFLGVADQAKEFTRPARFVKTFTRPKLDEINPLVSGGKVFDYLTKTRGLDPVVINRFKVGELQNAAKGAAIVFPIYEPTGKTVDLVKFLAVRRDPESGKKQIWSTADSKPHLFGWQAMNGDVREVVICEGEIDCLTIAAWGFPCLSLPQGASNMDWIEHDFEAVERFEKIYVCTDMDAAGNKAAEEMATRLGRERCYRVSFENFKDANEAHCSGKFLGPDFEECIQKAKTLDPSELCNIGDMGDAIWETLHPSDPKHVGTKPPVDLDWKCRFGELSIWTGWSGHGKSHILNQFLLHDAAQGENICIASFEMPVRKTGAKLIQMILGAIPEATARQSIEPALDILRSRFWAINHVGVMHWSKLMPLMKYAARRYGCTRFVVDSLLRCGVAEDDYNAQKEFVSELVAFAELYGHVHLIAHSRKAEDETKSPGKHDVRGAAAITDLCHNGFTVWRNKTKEAELEESRMIGSPPAPAIRDQPDAQIMMWKNREEGNEPFCKLWLDRPSAQFLNRGQTKPFNYLTKP